MRIPGQRDVCGSARVAARRPVPPPPPGGGHRGRDGHGRSGPAKAGPVEPSSLPGTPAQAGVEHPNRIKRTDQPEAARPHPGRPPRRARAPPATAQPTGRSEDAEPLRLVRIDAEPNHEAWSEDPWLPGSRRPDRRALIIGVVLIAGLLSVASTAWLIGVNPPQASSPHGTHLSRPSQPGPGHAQPSQALSGQPTPILIQPSQPPPSQLPAQPACSYPDRYGPGRDLARPDTASLDTTSPDTTRAAAATREPAGAGRGTAALASRAPAAGTTTGPGQGGPRPGPAPARAGARPGRLRLRPGPAHPGPAHPAPAHPALAAAPVRRPRTRTCRRLGPGVAGASAPTPGRRVDHAPSGRRG